MGGPWGGRSGRERGRLSWRSKGVIVEREDNEQVRSQKTGRDQDLIEKDDDTTLGPLDRPLPSEANHRLPWTVMSSKADNILGGNS